MYMQLVRLFAWKSPGLSRTYLGCDHQRRQTYIDAVSKTAGEPQLPSPVRYSHAVDESTSTRGTVPPDLPAYFDTYMLNFTLDRSYALLTLS